MKKILAVSAVITCSLAVLASPAQANSSGTRCPVAPSGFALWDVSAEPYAVDNLVDELGNNDGWACARPIYTVIDENGEPFQIYNFLDNKFQPNA
jgi:hypothetical protein